MQINKIRLVTCDVRLLSVAASLALVTAAVAVLSVLALDGTSAAMRYLSPEAVEFTALHGGLM